MPALRPLVAAALSAALLAAPAGAQDRPSEEEMFGKPPAEAQTPPAQPQKPPEPKQEPRPSEQELFGGQSTAPAAQPPPPVGVIAGEREDPLKIGGQIYLRAQTQWPEGVKPSDWSLSSPNLLDLFADVRPNDRVRGFVLGRMSFDPTLAAGQAVSVFGQPRLTLPIVSGASPANPGAALDQLWLNFDVFDRRGFLTAGRQHVKWGVGKFWNPTDYLHPVKRDPLAVFDIRTGTTMVKLQVPWEKRGWNFYGFGVFEDIAGETSLGTNRLGRIGVGGRAEIVLGSAELGLDALTQSGHHPRFGVDLSGGIGDFDLYAEAALRNGTDTPVWVPDSASLLGYRRSDPTGFAPQVVLGGNWSAKYSDEDIVTLGAEYFYNEPGYSSSRVYPTLLTVSALSPVPSFTVPAPTAADPNGTKQVANPLFGQPNPFNPFYLGKQYAAAYVALPNPGSWNNTTFTLSVLGNLADKSFLIRLDHSVLVVTYLRIETFVQGHAGNEGGEFRFGFESPARTLAGVTIPAFSVPAPVLDFGIAARVSL
jgi:hypothetical protein